MNKDLKKTKCTKCKETKSELSFSGANETICLQCKRAAKRAPKK